MEQGREHKTSPELFRAAISLGSNLGDRFHDIELALRLLEVPGKFLAQEKSDLGFPPESTVVDTSFMYETAPMYVTDQPSFINCACIIETNLPPVMLLRFLKHIESTVGRVPSIRNGPRAVDLDILLYEESIIDTRPENERESLVNLAGHLVVPHPKMIEREFVLRPLSDMSPWLIHPVLKLPIQKILENLPQLDPSMRKVIPFPRYPLPPNYPWPHTDIPAVPPTVSYWIYPIIKDDRPRPSVKRKTYLMATLNATPDSFSDGSAHNTLEAALSYAHESVNAGAAMMDIGGYSTRPGAAFVTPEEETNRVVPIIKAIRKTKADARVSEILLSVDTFRPEVARASIEAGVNCINDVYAFAGHEAFPSTDDAVSKRVDESMVTMKALVREFAVPVVLMHSRGDAGSNKEYGMYGSEYGAVLRGVQTELGDKVRRIITGKGCVRRWMVIVDPGIGFSKTVEGNLELLRDARRVVGDSHIGTTTMPNPLMGYPQLIGASRKSFLGVILSRGENGRETDPKERGWATAAAVACAVQQGALAVRVHDTREMADVVTVADELWS